MDPKPSPIHLAALNGDAPAFEALLHTDPKLATSLDVDSRTPLHWACVSGSVQIFRSLLSLPPAGAVSPQLLQSLAGEDGFGNYHIDINAQDEGGWSPLMIAISAGHEEIYTTLLKIPEINITCLNRGGQTILHFACSKSRIPAVESILATAEEKNLLRVKDRQGQLPLHRAAASGSLPITGMLLQAGSQLNSSDSGGWTALHHACSEGHGDVAVRLIQEGIDVDKTDRDGETAIKLCPLDGKCAKFVRSSCPEEFN